jgi:hypothetical protein
MPNDERLPHRAPPPIVACLADYGNDRLGMAAGTENEKLIGVTKAMRSLMAL